MCLDEARLLGAATSMVPPELGRPLHHANPTADQVHAGCARAAIFDHRRQR